MGAGREPLAALVAEGYRRFVADRPDATGVCRGCCMDPEIEARILDWPQDAIPKTDIADWYFAASENPFPRSVARWFLPRVLELLAEGEDVASVGNEVALRRLADAGFPEKWPEDDAAFLTRFGATLAEAVARAQGQSDEPVGRAGLQETVCMLALGGVDVAPAIAALDALPTGLLARALAEDWAWPRTGYFVDAFWEEGAAKDMVFGWLTGEALLERMLAHGMTENDGDPTRAAALQVAEAILQWREWMGTADGGGPTSATS